MQCGHDGAGVAEKVHAVMETLDNGVVWVEGLRTIMDWLEYGECYTWSSSNTGPKGFRTSFSDKILSLPSIPSPTLHTIRAIACESCTATPGVVRGLSDDLEDAIGGSD